MQFCNVFVSTDFAIQCHLKEIQEAFIAILSEPDGKLLMHHVEFVPPRSLLTSTSFVVFLDLSQDVASKGLGLVYEMGGVADQETLVSTLVETLMTGKR